MSKQTDRLRERGVHNDHGLAQGLPGRTPWISYVATDYMSPHSSRVQLRLAGRRFTSARSEDYGALSFTGFGLRYNGPRRWLALLEAMLYVSPRYGVAEWARTPFGGYMPLHALKARLEELGEKPRLEPLTPAGVMAAKLTVR